jgi:hypothetical protein
VRVSRAIAVLGPAIAHTSATRAARAALAIRVLAARAIGDAGAVAKLGPAIARASAARAGRATLAIRVLTARAIGDASAVTDLVIGLAREVRAFRLRRRDLPPRPEEPLPCDSSAGSRVGDSDRSKPSTDRYHCIRVPGSGWGVFLMVTNAGVPRCSLRRLIANVT